MADLTLNSHRYELLDEVFYHGKMVLMIFLYFFDDLDFYLILVHQVLEIHQVHLLVLELVDLHKHFLDHLILNLQSLILISEFILKILGTSLQGYDELEVLQALLSHLVALGQYPHLVGLVLL